MNAPTVGYVVVTYVGSTPVVFRRCSDLEEATRSAETMNALATRALPLERPWCVVAEVDGQIRPLDATEIVLARAFSAKRRRPEPAKAERPLYEVAGALQAEFRPHGWRVRTIPIHGGPWEAVGPLGQRVEAPNADVLGAMVRRRIAAAAAAAAGKAVHP